MALALGLTCLLNKCTPHSWYAGLGIASKLLSEVFRELDLVRFISLDDLLVTQQVTAQSDDAQFEQFSSTRSVDSSTLGDPTRPLRAWLASYPGPRLAWLATPYRHTHTRARTRTHISYLLLMLMLPMPMLVACCTTDGWQTKRRGGSALRARTVNLMPRESSFVRAAVVQ